MGRKTGNRENDRSKLDLLVAHRRRGKSGMLGSGAVPQMSRSAQSMGHLADRARRETQSSILARPHRGDDAHAVDHSGLPLLHGMKPPSLFPYTRRHNRRKHG